MAAIISGNELGLFNNPLAPRNDADIGRSGQSDAVYVNSATGNLVIQARDEYLAAIGPDLSLIRTYNSQGQFTDDNQDNWRLSVQRRVFGLTGTVNTAGSTITKEFGDGAQITYTYTNGIYISTEGDGAHDTLAFDETTQEWTWTDGSSRASEIYNNAGQLIESRDPDGNLTTYGYTGNLLTQITDPSGQVTHLDYTGTNLSQIRVVSQGQTQTLTRYFYDAQDRLTQVVVDLTPADNTAPLVDGNGDGLYETVNNESYVTTYTYDGTSTRIASITQGDGSSVHFTYQLVNGQYLIQSYADSEGKTTTLSYDGGGTTPITQTDLTDPLGTVTRYLTNADGRPEQVIIDPLDSLSNPNGVNLSTHYQYDPDGNLTQVIDPNGNATVMEYDGAGNLTLSRNSRGETTEYTYGPTNQRLTETRYSGLDPDGAGPGLPNTPLTTRYVYDPEEHLRFMISPEGRVTEHRYAANGNRSSTVTYAGGTYDLTGLGPADALNESQLVTWAAAQDLSQIERADYVYDFRGNLASTTTYASTDLTGAGLADGSESTTQFVYDQRGRLLQTLDARGSANTPDAVNPNIAYATTYLYDGLDRVLSTTEWVASGLTRTTFNTYDDLTRQTTVTLANGLITTSTYDARGRLTSVLQADPKQALGITDYLYDSAGRLRVTVDPLGNTTDALYDAAGRQVATIDATGALTETVYDAAGNVVETIGYANPVDPTARAALRDAGGNPIDNATHASVRPAATGDDRHAYNLYDTADRLIYTIDPHDTDPTQGYVSETKYDGAGRIIETVRYAGALAVPAAPTAANVAPLIQIDSANDRHARRFYDDDGFLIGTLDAEGYLGEYRYDTAGRLTETVHYGSPTDSALQATGDFDALKQSVLAQGSNPSDQKRYTFYDGKGQTIATLDAENYLTEYQYDQAGNQTQTVRYATRANPYTGSETLAELRPAPANNDRVTLTEYNGANEITQVTTNPQGTVTRYTYDDVGNRIQTDRASNTSEVRTTRARYDSRGHLVQELSGEGSVALDQLLTGTTQVTATADPGALSSTQTYALATGALTPPGIADPTPQPPSTFQQAYYDDAGRIVGVIDDSGTLINYVYDDAGHIVRVRRHVDSPAAPRWSQDFTTDAGGLTDLPAGFMTVENGHLTVTTQDSADTYEGVWGTRQQPFGDGVVFRAEVTTGPSSQDRYLVIGTEGDSDFGEYRRHAVYFGGDGIFALYYDDGYQSEWLGDARDNTTYVIEVQTDATGTTLYVYEKDQDRTSGFSDHRDFTDWGVVQTFIEAHGEPGAANATMVIDNLSEATVVGALIGDVVAPENGADQLTEFAYDESGRVTASVGPDGVLTSYQYDSFGNVASKRVYADTPSTPRWSQSFNVDAFGLSELPAGFMTVENGHLTITTQDSNDDYEGVWGNRLQPFSDGVIFRSEVTTGPSSAGRYLVIGTEGDGDFGQYRRHAAYFDDGGNVLASYYDGDWETATLGTVVDDTTYVVEVVTDTTGSTLYVYEKGQDRTSGFSDHRDFTDWGVVQTFIEAHGEPRAANATMFVDNMSEATAVGELQGHWIVNPSATDIIATTGNGDPYYTVQSGDTWASIAATLYGTADVAAELQAALGNPALTPGTPLSGLPATLSITVAPYYTVQSNDTWLSMTQTIYGTSDPSTIEALQTALGTPTLAPGLQLTVPQTLTYTTSGATQAQIDQVWGAYGIKHTYDLAGRRISTTDQNGLTTFFYYDAANRLRFTVNAEGEVSETDYDAFGETTDAVRYSGRIGTIGLVGGSITADLLNRVSGIASPAGNNADTHTHVNYTLRGATKETIAGFASGLDSTTGYTYNAFGETSTKTTELAASDSRTDRYDYDRRGSLIHTTEDQGGLERTTTQTLDAFGRTIETTDGNGVVRQYAYDLLGRQVATTLDPNSGLNLQTFTVYDAFGRTLTRTDGLGNDTTYTYDDAARSFTITTPEGIQTVSIENRHGETVSIEVNEADGTQHTLTIFQYDHNGNLAAETEGAGSLNLTTIHTYDKANRRILTQDANGTYTRYDYDAANRILTRTVDPQAIANPNDNPGGLNLQTAYVYDGQGRTLTVTEGVNDIVTGPRVTQTTYDAKGQIIEVAVDPAGLNLRTAYSYDARGKALTVTQGAGTSDARTTRYEYDHLGRRTLKAQDPSGLDIRCVYEYDANDNLIKKTEAEGTTDTQTTRYVYDHANRRAFEIDALGFVTESLYDQNSNVIATVRYATALAGTAIDEIDLNPGQALATVSVNLDTSGTERFTVSVFDQDNRQRFSIDALGFLTESAYNAAGQVTDTIAYQTALNAPAVLLAAGFTAAEVQAMTPDQIRLALVEALNVANIAAGVSQSPGFDQRTHYVYDAAGRQTSCIHAQGSTVEYTETYAYDNTGNRIRRTDGRGNSEYFAYDAAGRLARHIDMMGYVVTSAYDNLGNLTAETTYMNAVAMPATADDYWAYAGHAPAPTADNDPVSGDRTTSYTYDKAGRRDSQTDPSINGAAGVVTRYAYDPVGNLIDKTEAFGLLQARTTHSVYDKLNRLTEQTTAYGAPEAATSRFDYDRLGNQKSYIDPRGVDLAEHDTDWAVAERTRLGFPAQAAALTPAQADTLRALYATTQDFDELNRKIGVTDAVGATTATRYDSFGNIVKVTDPNNNVGYFYYDALNRIELQLDAEGYATRTIYDGFGNTKETVRYANKVQGSYDETTRPQILAAPPGNPPPTAYLVVVDAKDQHTVAEYDALSRTSKITDAENHFETFVYDAQGNVESHRDKNLNLFEYDYDAKGNKIAEFLPITSADSAGSQVQVINRYEYDAVGNKTKSIEAQGLPEERITEYRYDKRDRLIETTNAPTRVALTPAEADTGGSLQLTSDRRVYDSRGNLVGETDASGFTTFHYYDSNNRRIGTVDAERYLHRYFYDAVGNLTGERTYGDPVPAQLSLAVLPDAAAISGMDSSKYRETTYRYNANNQRVETRSQTVLVYDRAVGLQSRPLVETQQYDANGNVVLSTDANGARTFYYYDKVGNRVLQVDPIGYVTAWDVDANGNIQTESRYANPLSAATLAALSVQDDPSQLRGEVASANNPDNRATTYSYDRMNRKTLESIENLAISTISSGNGALSTHIDSATTQYLYDGIGNTAAVISAGARTDYEFDAMNRLTRQQDPGFTDFEGAAVRTTTIMQYDGVGNVRTSTLIGKVTADDQVTHYEYDSRGNLVRQIDPDNNPTEYFYDANGNVTFARHHRTDADNVQSAFYISYTYDKLNRQTATVDGENVRRHSTYDAYGEIVARGVNGIDQEYDEYDVAGRLVKTNKDDGVNRAYLYDAAGNETAIIQSADTDVNGVASTTGIDLRALSIDQIAALPANVVQRTESEYDARGGVVATFQPQMQFTPDVTSGTVEQWEDVFDNPFRGGTIHVVRSPKLIQFTGQNGDATTLQLWLWQTGSAKPTNPIVLSRDTSGGVPIQGQFSLDWSAYANAQYDYEFRTLDAANQELDRVKGTLRLDSAAATDAGWRTPDVMSEGSGSFNFNLVEDASGDIVVVWYEFNPSPDFGDDRLMVNRYVVGQGWQGAQAISNTVDSTSGKKPVLAAGSDGSVMLTWMDGSGQSARLYSSRYVPGQGWQGAQLIRAFNAAFLAGTGDADLVVGASGNALAVWNESSDGVTQSVLASRYIDGFGWQPAQVLDGAAAYGERPQIAVDQYGNAFVLWQQKVGSVRNILGKRYSVSNGWLPTESLASNVNRLFSLTVSKLGDAVVGWSSPDGNVYARRYDFSGGGWQSTETIHSGAGTVSTVETAINNRGDILVSWLRSRDANNIDVVTNRYVSGQGWGSPLVVESSNQALAQYLDVGIDDNGDGMVLWSELMLDGSGRSRTWANRYLVGLGWEGAAEVPNFGVSASARLVFRDRNRALALWLDEPTVGNDQLVVSDFVGFGVMTKYIHTVQPVLTPGTTSQSAIVRRQTYNAFGEIAEETDGRQHTTTFVYDARGQLISKSDSETNVTGENGAIARLRPTTRYFYDALGRLVATSDPNGNVSTQRYDAAGHLVATYEGQRYDQNGTLVSMAGGVNGYGYDVFGNRRFRDDELNRRTRYTYDAKNQLKRVDHPTDSAFDNAPRFDLYDYDGLGHRLRHTNSLGQSELTDYDTTGRVTRTVSFGGINTTYSYVVDNATGSATQTTTMGDGRSLIDSKDYFGRLLAHTDLAGHSFDYTYNLAGWLVKQTSSVGQYIEFAYYHNGLLEEVRDRVLNTWSRYEYDENGNRTFEGYFRAGPNPFYYQWSRATYDELNRVSSIDDYQYNVTYEYDANGNRRHIYARYHDGDNNNVQRQDYWYAYDAMNRFVVTKGSLSGSTVDSTGEPIWNRGSGVIEAGADGYAISHNAAGERASATYQAPDGTAVRETYVYAAGGLLEHVETDTSPNDGLPGYVSARRLYYANGTVKQYFEYDSSGSVTRNYQYTYTGDGKVETENNGEFTSNYTYDAAGNLSTIVSPQSGGTTLTTTYHYEYWDAAKQKEIRLQASNEQAPGWAPGLSRFIYDVNGHLTQVSDIVADRHLNYRLDADGRILQRDELIAGTSSRTQHYYYLNGIGVGDAGDFGSSRQDYATLLASRGQGNSSRAPVTSADFDYNFEPINDQYPATTPGSYTVRQGDTLQSVALAVWGDASLWYIIADANGIGSDTTLSAGQTLVIPNVVANVHNDASTFRVYNPGEAIGDTAPTLPDPPPPPQQGGGGCGGLGAILVIVVTIVVAVVAPEALGITSQFWGAVVGAAAGSVAGQVTAISLGLQDKFSWKAVAVAAATAGITKGLKIDEIANPAVREATKNAISQGTNILLGQQEKFSWTSLAVSAISAPINEKIDEKFGSVNNNRQNAGYVQLPGGGAPFSLDRFGKNLVGEFLKSTTQSAATILVNRGGKLDWNNVATQALGDAIGNTIGNDIKYRYAKARQAEAQQARMQRLNGYAELHVVNGQAVDAAGNPVNLPPQFAGPEASGMSKGSDRLNSADPYPTADYLDDGTIVMRMGTRKLSLGPPRTGDDLTSADQVTSLAPDGVRYYPSTPENPKGLSPEEWVAWSMTTEGLMNRILSAPSLPKDFDGTFVTPDNSLDINAWRARGQANIAFALGAPTAVGVGAALVPGAATGVSAGYDWLGTAYATLGEYLAPAYVMASSAVTTGMNRVSDLFTRLWTSPLATNATAQQRALDLTTSSLPGTPPTPNLEGLVGAAVNNELHPEENLR